MQSDRGQEGTGRQRGKVGEGPGETERHGTGRDRKRALRPSSKGSSGPQAAVAQAAPQAPQNLLPNPSPLFPPRLWPQLPFG